MMRQCPGRIQFDGRGRRNVACYVSVCATSIFSSKSFLSPSSLPLNSNAFVTAAFPFSTLVITYEQPNQFARIDVIAILRRIGTRVAAAGNRSHTTGVPIHLAE